MDLLESLKYSLENQSREQGNTLYPSSVIAYIDKSLSWDMSIEGYLFWAILHNSYMVHGIYDYVSIIKLYHIFGRDVFQYEMTIYYYYRDCFDKTTYTLTDDCFEKLCKDLEENGAIRKS